MNRCTCPLACVFRKPLKEHRGLLAPPGTLFRASVFVRASVFAVGSVMGWADEGASAQVLPSCPAQSERLLRVHEASTSCPFTAGHQIADAEPSISPGRAFLYSALVPGLGQRKLGKGRWLAYLAVEGATWIAFGQARRSATDGRDQYRDLAWDVSRTFSGPRVDGDFPYYESMQSFEVSGAFDTDQVAPGIQPQMDPSSFNGRAWLLATEIHFSPGANPLPGDPEYVAALAEYRDRAYDESFEWSWAGQSEAWTEYMDLIESSDSSFRRASQFLGVVIANHLISGIDAFLISKIPSSGSDRAQAQIRLEPRADRRGVQVVLWVRR